MTATRQPLVAGNWKMNGLRQDGLELAREVAHCARMAARTGDPCTKTEVVVCPPSTLLFLMAEELTGSPVRLGAQDCHAKRSGAYTGDIAPTMLRDAGCSYVILGHSERRALHYESDADVHAKANAALAEGLLAIICVGETEAERDRGEAFAVVARQIAHSVPSNALPETVVIAYEPVWAIGTGRTPTSPDIQAMHNHIRGLLAAKLTRGGDVRVLYGGSVKPTNAVEVLGLPDVDGALVGGCSLKAQEFWAIVIAAPSR